MQKSNMKPTVSRRALTIGAAGAAVWFGLLAAAPARASGEAAEAFVQRRAEEVIAAANAGSSSRFVSLLRRHANIEEIATFALGTYASQLPSGTRSRYVRLFEGWVGSQFKAHANVLTGKTFEVIRATGGPQDYIVNGRILGGETMPVSFRVRKSGSSFRVRDVNIGGIWLTIQLRTTITRQLSQSNGDFDALFSYLR